MTDRHVRRSGSDYREAFFNLLPNGQAWPKKAIGSVLWQTSDGLCEYWGYVDGRAADLLEIESDPRTTVELLPDWERNWGLPDPCYTAPQTVDQRQTALIQRMTLLGAQSRQFYIDFAAKLGYEITISEYRPFMVGLDCCGDGRVYGDDGSGSMRGPAATSATPAPLYYNNNFVSGWLPVYSTNGTPLLTPVVGGASLGLAAGVGAAIGRSPTYSVGLATGLGGATGAGRSTTPGVAFGDARGTVTAAAVGRATFSAKGTATDHGVANGVGAGTMIGYNDIYHPAITSWGYNNERGSHRNLVTLTGNSAGQLRFTIEVVCNMSGNGAYSDASNVSFGKWTGSSFDTTAAPIEVKFGGASGYTGPRAGAQAQALVSDIVSHPGLTLSTGDTLVVVIDQNSTDATTTGQASMTDGALATEVCGWYAFTTTWNSATPGAAGSGNTFTNRGVAKVETQTTVPITFVSGVGNASGVGSALGYQGGTATLIWSDEFDSYPTVVSSASGNQSDTTSNWRYDAIWQSPDLGYRDFAGTNWNINPNDPHYAGYNPFSVSGSVLTIQSFRTPPALTAQIRADLDAQGNTGLAVPAWCGGFLQTNSKKRHFVYCYMEWKARFAIPGKGMFPAMWTYSSDLGNDPQGKGAAEVDVFELFGAPNSVNTSLHMAGANYSPGVGYGVPGSPFSEDTSGWHTYGYDRQPGYLKFYYDGVLTCTISGADAAWFNNVNMDIIINFAMDASWFGSGLSSDGTTPSPMTMEVDYVRVYTSKP